MSGKTKKVGREMKQIPLSELPEQVQLQFEVNSDGSKDPKYSEKDIFEAKKKVVKEKKVLPKSERLKKARADGAKLSAKAQLENEKLKSSGKYKYSQN
jgi:hypothetical protein